MSAAMKRFGFKANLAAAPSGLALRFPGVVRSVGPAEEGGGITLDIPGAKQLHQGKS
jgi:hypothetical protein